MHIPAQSQEHVRLNDVLLQLRPSLPGLRRKLPSLVRSVHTEDCRLSGAKLDSYGRSHLGAFVPVQKSDFGCCGRLFGGELALQ